VLWLFDRRFGPAAHRFDLRARRVGSEAVRCGLQVNPDVRMKEILPDAAKDWQFDRA